MIKNPELPYVKESFVCDCDGHILTITYFPKEGNEKVIDIPNDGIFSRENIYIYTQLTSGYWKFKKKLEVCWKILRGRKAFLEEVELTGTDVDRFLNFQKDVLEVRKSEKEKNEKI